MAYMEIIYYKIDSINPTIIGTYTDKMCERYQKFVLFEEVGEWNVLTVRGEYQKR